MHTIVYIIRLSAYKCILSILVSQQNGLILSRRPRTIYPSHVSCSMDFGCGSESQLQGLIQTWGIQWNTTEMLQIPLS